MSCTEEEPENFGTIRIEMAPLNGDPTIFDGTVEVVATVHYQGCLEDFYLKRKPTHQQDGPDGAAVFTDWESRLCSDFSDIPDCEVTNITQTLREVDEVYNLSVTYKINDASSLQYREVHVGPIPVEAFAGCDAGVRPLVELGQTGLIGRDAGGNNIWRISTLPGTNEAFANQGAPLRIEVIAN